MFLFRKKVKPVWVWVFLSVLGVHYWMILLAHVLTSGHLSITGLWQMMVQRLAEPGDATRYLDIAGNGYVKTGENAINLVFYPLYPLLIRVFGWATGSLPLAGVIISQGCYGAASVLLYELVLMDGTPKQAWYSVMLMALYPFSMFAMGVFTEGLFLLLSIGCLLAIRKRKYVWAGCVGFLASLTRIQGMLLIIPAVYEWAVSVFGPGKCRKRWTDSLILLIPAGFAVYLGINYRLHGNCFQFLLFEAGEPWYQTSRWIGENIAQHYTLAQEYPYLAGIIYWVQIALYFFALSVLAWGICKKVRTAYLLYGCAYLGFTYLSGWMISGGRYMLCCVPLYIVLTGMKSETGKKLVLIAAGALFFSYSLFYLRAFAIM